MPATARTRSWLRFATLALALTALAGTASAQTWSAEVIPTEPNGKDKNPAPSVKVKMVGETMPGPDVWQTTVLKQADFKQPGTNPNRAIPFHKGSETLGIVVVVEGHEFYFGNDKYRVANNCQRQPTDPPIDPKAPPCRIVKASAGVFEIIKSALETPGGKDDEIPTTISRAGPPGSKGALVVYSAGAESKFQGELKNFNAEKLGEQSAQQGKTSRDLMEGLSMAADILKKIGTNRKALFIISDGFDAGSPADITKLKKRLDDDKVEVYAFYLEAGSEFIQDDATTITASKTRMNILGAPSIRVKDQAALATNITAKISELNSRYTLIFPGSVTDPKTKVKKGFNWDDKEHEFTLKRGDDEIANANKAGDVAPVLLTLSPKWGQSSGGGKWWLWIVIPGGVLLLGIIIAVASGKKPAPAPPPMMVAAPAGAPPPPPSAPANANKTMMVNISSGDGLPVVGWVVPIAGEKQFQTFKLQYGETRIGTTSNSHIVLNDGFMSTDHAKIVMSPTGFTLVDGGSTNGTFANERRIQRHELVDNDMIMFGKTVCKFKTILGT